ncbi:MAG: hypothetical protein HC927_13370, partial [Deltaproteobacteria bacterium]|nr:hypothetical protein [Deltaproteobacteria bacterium]
MTSQPYTAGMSKAEIRDLLAAGKLYVSHFADLDNDGRSELIAQIGDAGLALLYLDVDERYSPLWLEGLVLHEVVDLDGDGDDELIVSEFDQRRGRKSSPIWVLGSGDEQLPMLARANARVSPPQALAPELGELWQRA